VENLTAFVDRCEADLGTSNSLRAKSLSVLDESLLDDLNHVVATTADSSQVDKN